MDRLKKLDLPGASLGFCEDFLTKEEADLLFEELEETTPWREDKIFIFGKYHTLPRLQQWYGTKSYKWSGISLDPIIWTPSLDFIRKRIEKETGHTFNSCLLNLYRNGKDTVGWHADNEPEFGVKPYIASLSLGVARDFMLRRKDDHKIKQKLLLSNGSLLTMGGTCQEFWDHCLPRRTRVYKSRINLTFRKIV